MMIVRKDTRSAVVIFVLSQHQIARLQILSKLQQPMKKIIVERKSKLELIAITLKLTKASHWLGFHSLQVVKLQMLHALKMIYSLNSKVGCFIHYRTCQQKDEINLKWSQIMPLI